MMTKIDIIHMQIIECSNRGIPFVECPYYLMVGLSKNFNPKQLPINALRHPPEGVTTGWYIWSGHEFSSDPEFFEPIHCLHLQEICPGILKYLGLPPGWRFLVADEYEDVWTDDQLFNVAPSTNSNMIEYFVRNKSSFLGE